MTIDRLIQNTRKFDPKKEVRFFHQASIRPRIEKITAWPGTKTILFHGDAQSGTDSKHYDVYLFFSDVDFVEQPHPDFPHGITITGNNYWFEDIYPKHNPVKVRCDCRDFHWTFEWYLTKVDALYQHVGGPASFKTKGVRPPRNPKGIPGVCKHVLAFFDLLDQQGIIH